MNDSLNDAISAVKSGDADSARKLLVQIIKANPTSEDAEIAWIWLSAVVDSTEEKRKCLESSLRLNPNNELAVRGLSKLDAIDDVIDLHGSGKIDILAETNKPSEIKLAPDSVIEQPPGSELGIDNQSINYQHEREELNGFGTDTIPAYIYLFIGLLGCLLMALGVFAPLISVPLVGGINYFQYGSWEGIIVLGLTGISLVLLMARRYRWLWLTGFSSLGMISAAFYRFASHITEFQKDKALQSVLESELVSGPNSLLSSSIQLQWGWALLFIGAAFILIAANTKTKPDEGFYWNAALVGVLLFIVFFTALYILPIVGYQVLFELF